MLCLHFWERNRINFRLDSLWAAEVCPSAYLQALPTTVRCSSPPLRPILHSPVFLGTVRDKLMAKTGLSASCTIGVEWGMDWKEWILCCPNYMYIWKKSSSLKIKVSLRNFLSLGNLPSPYKQPQYWSRFLIHTVFHSHCRESRSFTPLTGSHTLGITEYGIFMDPLEVLSQLKIFNLK